MNSINSTKMSKQSLLWKQAALQENPRGWTWKNIVFYPVHSFLYKLKNNPSILVDELIIGSNPILNLLLLHKISQDAIVKKEYKKIALFSMEQIDYWAYECIQNEKFFAEIERIYGLKATSIEELIHQIINNFAYQYIELYLIKDNGWRINYYNKDVYMDAWIFHLIEAESISDVKVSSYIKIQNDIRNMINSEFLKQLNRADFIKQVKWVNVSKANYPIIMSKDLKVTSLPQGWMNMDSEDVEQCVYFKHEASNNSFGSAVCIPTLPSELNSNAFKQLEV